MESAGTYVKEVAVVSCVCKVDERKRETFISSTQIAKEINVDPSQVAKDLFVNISGKTRVGYDINALVDVLEDFLGFTSQHKAFLFGVGSLGASLLHDTGLSQYGLEIVAGFDVREDLDGSMINGIPVFHMDDFPAKQKEYGATIGVITVPVEKAQEVTDRIIEEESRLFGILPRSVYGCRNIS